jgi:putative ATP-binding cassette transporter
MHPMEALLEAIPALSRTRVSLERMHGVGATSPRGLAVPAPGRSVPALASVALAGATHRYRRDDEDGLFQLGPISLELRTGEIVFLAGGNGSGKTTLAKLLVGLYEPDAGAVLANDTPVSAAERDDYRQNFSAVFSDFHLFDSLLGQTRTALDERAKELLAALDLGHKVSIVDGVFSTTQLSRGQQKRLALLVAVLEDRAIYVFDEWAADQDPVYKDVFYRRVLPELKARGKAVFAITHDDAYFHLADRFLTLDQGRLRAPGPTPRAMAPALGTAE